MMEAETAMGYLRGQRYCEVLLGSGGFFVPKKLMVYNTVGLNDCPVAQWSQLTVEKVKAQSGSKFVRLNGPRYWMLDAFVRSQLLDTGLCCFGGIEMRLAGVLSLNLRKAGPYKQHSVQRKTTSLFRGGLPVYQLIDPEGGVYFMQSYSLEKKAQTMDTLPLLQQELHLPKGWSFRSVVLKNDYQLKAVSDLAIVTVDHFMNAYQLSTAQADDEL